MIQRIEENNISQQISISINPSLPLFKLDKGMLEQVLYNLLSNAAAYTPSNSLISISAHGYADILEIIIEDNGPGFPENEMHKVFDKFYRLDNSATGGTGLGLSIVKGFTEAMGGRVTLENKREGGARFILSFKTEISNLKISHE